MASLPSLAPAAALLLPASATIDNTLGAVFLGNIFVAMLFAITTVQTYTYYQRNTQDSYVMRCAVFLMWVVDVLNFALITHSVYSYAITNYANPVALFYVEWSFAACISVGGVSNFMVTCVYASRLWKFSGRRIPGRLVVVVVMLGETICLVGDITVNILAMRSPRTFLAFQQRYEWTWFVAFGTRAAVDVIIATSTVIMLYRSSPGSNSGVNSIIHVIVKYSINTCLLTTVCSLLPILLYAMLPNTLLTFATGMQLPKLMLNSLLAMLNSRQTMREQYAPPAKRGYAVDVSRTRNSAEHDLSSNAETIYLHAGCTTAGNGKISASPSTMALNSEGPS